MPQFWQSINVLCFFDQRKEFVRKTYSISKVAIDQDEHFLVERVLVLDPAKSTANGNMYGLSNVYALILLLSWYNTDMFYL